jgi:hypothetical protein
MARKYRVAVELTPKQLEALMDISLAGHVAEDKYSLAGGAALRTLYDALRMAKKGKRALTGKEKTRWNRTTWNTR